MRAAMAVLAAEQEASPDRDLGRGLHLDREDIKAAARVGIDMEEEAIEAEAIRAARVL
jgi:hypothetical protein